MPGDRYDAVIVGSGQGGNPMAGYLAGAGRRVALVEMSQVGGSCVNWGCTPTKTMFASARAASWAQRAQEYGIRTGAVQARMPDIAARKRAVVSRFREGVMQGLDAAGVKLIRGRARFVGPRRLEVELTGGGTAELEAETVLLNTGARLAVPSIDGLDAVPWLDSTSITELDALPRHLIVIGGGYIGLEFGQMFRHYGSRITIVEAADQLLAREDEDIARAVEEVLRDDGIDVRLRTQVRRVRSLDGGEVGLELAGPNSETIRGSHLLVATGRRPNTDDLGLDHAGIETDGRGYVVVDDRLQTTAPGVYALGDIVPGPAFTHVSYDHSRVLRQNLVGAGGASIRGRIVPYAVFIEPQLGRVGLSEREANERGIPYRVARTPAGYISRAIETGETRGVWKALVAPDTGRILGAAILGLEGGEVMAMLQIAMMGDLPYPALRDGIFTHPTLAEGLNNLFAELGDPGVSR